MAPRHLFSTLLVIVILFVGYFGGWVPRSEEVTSDSSFLFSAPQPRDCVYVVAVVLREVDGGYYEASVGSDDGLKLKVRGMVVRGDEYLGEAVVQKMSGDRCLITLDLRSGASIRRGDHVQFEFANR